MPKSSNRSSKFIPLIKCLTICIGVSITVLLIHLSQNIYAVQKFTDFFNQNNAQIYKAVIKGKINFPLWGKMPIQSFKEEGFITVDLGSVSPFACRQLLKSDIPFAHHFWINNKKADKYTSHLCGYISKVPMLLQFSNQFQSFETSLSKPDDCTTQDLFYSIGICAKTCLNYKHCQKLSMPQIVPIR